MKNCLQLSLGTGHYLCAGEGGGWGKSWGGPGLFSLQKREFRDGSGWDENGKKLIPNDWQPRSNIKKLFEQGKLSINASDAITEFSSKFIVDQKLVKNEIRKQERRKEKQV